MRGRRPKPTALKKLQGNPGHRRLNELEPVPAAVAPPCPAFIQGAARQHWDEVAPELEAMGVLSRIDGPMLAAYCEAFAQWRKALDMLKLGYVLKTASGYPLLSPYVTVAEKSLRTMRAIASEFGMTPSSRSRLRVERPAAAENPLQEFMKRAPSNRPPLVQ